MVAFVFIRKIIEKMEFKRKSDLHLTRKIWHMTTVFAMFSVYNWTEYKTSMIFLSVAFLLFVPADLLRHKLPILNDYLVLFFKPIMRQNEVNHYAGTTFLLIGVMTIVFFFAKSIVALSLLFLAFADPIASFVGIKYGKDKIFGHKSVQGFIAAYVVCSVLTYLYLYLTTTQLDHLFIVSIIAGLVGALAELIPVAKIDDNFTIPVFSAIGLQILFYFFGFN